jgi:hypothetical protein
MAGRHPQLRVVDVWRDDLFKPALPVLGLDGVHQHVVDVGPLRQEEGRARAQLVEKEQLLLLGEKEKKLSLSSRFLTIEIDQKIGLEPWTKGLKMKQQKTSELW